MDKLKLMKTANEIRKGIVSSVHSAKAGHPGGSLSAADIFTYLYFEELNIDPKEPKKADRDRFVLSKGSLGQGISAAVGMAIAGKMDEADYRVYTLLGDGEIQEGQVWEASMLAASHKLDNLVVIVDNNNLQIDGKIADVIDPYSIEEKFRSFGFQVININGHDIEEIIKAFEVAKNVKNKPTCIIAKTIKGKGVSFMEDKVEWHGKAPNKQQYEQAIKELK